MKDILHYSMLQAYPQIIVENRKGGAPGCGFADPAQGVDLDLNAIQWNDINGASLTTDNSGTVTSAVVGIHGSTNNAINNPNGSTHDSKCYVTLPAGNYVVESNILSMEAGLNSLASKFTIYNLTDDVELATFRCPTGGAQKNSGTSSRFSLPAQKNVSVRIYAHTGITGNISNLGEVSTGIQAGLTNVFDVIIFTKIG
jgi:hypothetical protein